MIEDEKDLRREFWNQNRILLRLHYRSGRRQNAYPAEVRTAWVDFVDYMQKSGEITEELADEATL